MVGRLWMELIANVVNPTFVIVEIQ